MRSPLSALLALCFFPTVIPIAAQSPSADLPATNPFATASKLFDQAPPFDKIKDADYGSALTAGMAGQRAEITAIAANLEPPTFENTIVAMERSGEILTRTSKVFFNLTESNTNEVLQKVQSEMAPKLAEHRDAIFLDAKLFARVQAIYDARAGLKLDPESLRLVERYQMQFIRAGAQLAETEKEKIRKLNSEEATLSTDFSRHVLEETNASAIVIDDKTQLDGLSDEDINAAAEAAKARKLEGKWLITLQNTTIQPVLVTLRNRALREKIYRASVERCQHDGPNDNRQIIARLAQLRAQKAAVLGYPNYAAYVLEDQMAKTPETAEKLLTDIVPAAVANAKAEAAKIQQVIDSQQGGFKLEPWDWAFYAEQVRKAEFNLDEAQIRPYFEMESVLQKGVFYAAGELYGLTFAERKDLPVYQPDVRVFEVFDKDKKSKALIYLDYFSRESKRGGAWMDTFVDQSNLLNLRPVAVNVTNVSKPAAGQPALLSFQEVSTMFHEFGHLLHGILSRTEYPFFSGTATPRDFVEFPSQFNENWALEPKVFANYAKHYQTGEPMPAELVAKIRKASTFDQGYKTVEYVAASLLDLAWHELPADAPLQQAGAFETAALEKRGIAVPEVPPRYHSTYFSHVWGGGYAAGYYSYLWTEVLALDAYDWFGEHGGLTAANGKHYEDTVLSRGGTKEAEQLYLDFRGRKASVEPLLKHRGLKSSAAETGKPLTQVDSEAAAMAQFEKLLAAQKSNDYEAFVADADLRLKAALSKTQFEASSELLNKRLGKGYDLSPLGSVKQNGFLVSLFRLRCKDQADDILATLSTKDGKVGGIYFK